jgi:hypothetical protein
MTLFYINGNKLLVINVTYFSRIVVDKNCKNFKKKKNMKVKSNIALAQNSMLRPLA